MFLEHKIFSHGWICFLQQCSRNNLTACMLEICQILHKKIEPQYMVLRLRLKRHGNIPNGMVENYNVLERDHIFRSHSITISSDLRGTSRCPEAMMLNWLLGLAGTLSNAYSLFFV